MLYRDANRNPTLPMQPSPMLYSGHFNNPLRRYNPHQCCVPASSITLPRPCNSRGSCFDHFRFNVLYSD
uniref:Uncharacterized protein n=1 Tax=Nelumbo nucifera TaxID=4432 RepID=A0A822YG77_NELNU|nr:TPA_asm: hypothetical protein HUJ06_010283 [Nelumbo nucifera]